MNELCQKGEIDLTEEGLKKYLEENGRTVEAVCKKLNDAGLTAVEGNKLVLMTDQCACMVLPDGRFVAAENKSG